MSRQPCPNEHEGCPIFEREGGCFSDIDHIVPKRLGTTALSFYYIRYHPENKQRLCRAEHEQKTREGDEPLPSDEYMRTAILQAIGEGALSLSANWSKRLNLEQRQPRSDAA